LPFISAFFPGVENRGYAPAQIIHRRFFIMGGEISLISSVIGLISSAQQPDVPDNSAALEAERKAREEEQRKKEAEERKRDRDKVLEARSAEKSARASKSASSTLASGSGVLKDDPSVSATKLKQKLGE
jgi:hypothetical protein